MQPIIERSLENHLHALDILKTLQPTIEKIAGLCVSALRDKKKIIFMGNGGSAADSQHLAAELVGRFKKNRAAWSALALSTNTSIITAIGNDYDYAQVFARQVEALGQKGDVIFAISTSGRSGNVVKAIEQAKKMGLTTVGFLGQDGGTLKGIVDVALTITTDDTPRIQEMHTLAGHIICEIIEETLTTG